MEECIRRPRGIPLEILLSDISFCANPTFFFDFAEFKHPIGSVNSLPGSRVTHRNKRHNHTIEAKASKVRYEDKKKDEVR